MNNGRIRYEKIETGVLIIGAGAGGLRVAIELAENGVPCLVLGKRRHGDAHTIWAAGGINASLGTLDPEDRWQIHAADTVREGHFVCDPRAVELLTRNTSDRVLELAEWGCGFNRTEDGGIDQRFFGAQAYRRACFAGDRTGEEILDTLVERARTLDVSYRDNFFVTKILVQDERTVGAVGYDLQTGEYAVFGARAVVLAAGGLTALYLRSSSRKEENTGDAAALAYEAGASLRDMEFVQFHPTGMVKPEEMGGMLVTEAVRGEGGRLLNTDGERFMERYSPEHMELDARDVVARANYAEIQAGRGTQNDAVLLDVSHRDADHVRERLPKMYSRFEEQGVDITREPMEVAPTAHYAMGGVEVDFDTGATAVEGLFAVGEGTAGTHGANRLGGNSLAETLVFGKITGEHLVEYATDGLPLPIDRSSVEEHLDALKHLRNSSGAHDSEELADELRRLLWDHAGIVRTGNGLREGLEKLEDLRHRGQSLSVGSDADGRKFEAALNLRFMILAAEAILRSALTREESRGAHHREDVPETRSEWQKNILCAEGEDGAMRLWYVPAGEVSEEIRAALQEDHTPNYHHLE